MRRTPQSSLAEQLAGIAKLSRAELLERWLATYGRPPPKGISRRLLEYAAAYDLQLRALPISRQKAVTKLREKLAMGSIQREPPSKNRRKLNPGSRLVREWHGRTYSVEVLDRGFLFEGNRYRSLSEIARQITGAHWSGPRFFQP